jgi:hypothetical protein
MFSIPKRIRTKVGIADGGLDQPLLLYESDKRDVVQPFSVGPRNCPGKM